MSAATPARFSRERLVEEHLPLVDALAARFRHSGEPVEDLRQVGALGLLYAIDRYDADRGLPLEAFAIPTILGEIRRHLRDHCWAVQVPRRAQELRPRLRRSELALTARLGRPPTVAELAVHAGISALDVAAAREADNARHAEPLSEDSGDPAGEEEALRRAEERAMLQRAMRRLDHRTRRILLLRFVGELSQREIAQAVGVSQVHVSRLIRDGLAALARNLASEPPPVVPRRSRP